MTLLSERIAMAYVRLKRRGIKMTDAELGRRAGVSRATVGDWRHGRTKEITGVTLLKAAKALNVRPEWLGSGEEPIAPDFAVAETAAAYDSVNVTRGPDTRGWVPLISWIQAGSWHEAEDNYYPGDGEEMIPCPASHGLHSYALRVEGDSMTAQHGKTYPHGSIIYVDPDQRGGVVSGNRVIAKISGSAEVTFKVFVEDAGVRFLKPLNPQYPIIRDEFRIIGKVIGKFEPE